MKKLYLGLILSISLCGIAWSGELRSKALSGDTHAQLVLAIEFLQGKEGRTRNPEIAVYWLRKSAQGGNALARYNYGVCLEQGVGVEKSGLLAYKEYEQAEKAGIAEAKFRRAMLLYRGVAPESNADFIRPGITAEPIRAKEILQSLADNGLASAQRALAQFILRSEPDKQTTEELAKAVKLLERAAKRGDAPALRLLADCYYGGIGVSPDNKLMVKYLEQAVKAGDLEAYGKLAFCYENGIGVEPDDKRAFELLDFAAKAGLPMALAKLGEFYLVGKFVEQNVPQAIKLYELASKAGNGYAKLRLGVCYDSGIGVEENKPQAARLFLEAARLGEVGAQYNVAIIYQTGDGFPKDDGASAYWFQRGAEQNHLPSMREFAICLIEGKGVEKNEIAGVELLKKAAQAGDVSARNLLGTLN